MPIKKISTQLTSTSYFNLFIASMQRPIKTVAKVGRSVAIEAI
jgi:hypothetical protein